VLFDHLLIPGSAPITHYALAYGDGTTYEADIPNLVFEHLYTSPGVFRTSVVVTNASGLTGTSGCTFACTRLSIHRDPIRRSPIPGMAVVGHSAAMASGATLRVQERARITAEKRRGAHSVT